jgi:tetratricopeptide (TPR) repeat protein
VDKAIADYDQAIALDPNMTIAYGNRAAAWLRKADAGRAVADAEAAIRVKPDFVPGHQIRADALKSQGRRDDAVAEYRRVLELGPDAETKAAAEAALRDLGATP